MPDTDRASSVFGFLFVFLCHARLDRASSVFAVAFFVKKKDKRIKTLDPRVRKDDGKRRKLRDRGAATPAGAGMWRDKIARRH